MAFASVAVPTVVKVPPLVPALLARGDPKARQFALHLCHLAGTQELHFLLTDVRVRVDGDTAVVTCTENILTGESAPGGRVGGIGAAAATNVLRRRAGTWRLLTHHASPLPSEVEQ